MLRGKERKKRKKEWICKVNRGRWRRFIYIKDSLQGEKNRRRKWKNKCRKNNNRFKKLKLKKERERKKGKLHRTAKTQWRGRGL